MGVVDSGVVAARKKPAVAHLHNVYHQLSLSAVRELERQGIPIVMTLHDYKPVCPAYLLMTGGEVCERCRGGRFYNAALIASAPMVAACANSPLLFGKKLWQETRIPLFEQAVAIPCFRDGSGRPVHRVCFGSRDLKNSIAELFVENRDKFPILLPFRYKDSSNPFAHLQLHNGTIWRWNRPLLSLSDEGLLQLRIEHRAIAAGPAITDNIANIALFYGLAHYLSSLNPAPELQLDFAMAERNFYAAARHGLNAPINWIDGRSWTMQDLLLEELVPAAASCLRTLGTSTTDIETYLEGVIRPRIASRRTGAQWQLDSFHRHGGDTSKMLAEYWENQSRGPVHQWP